MLDPSFFVNLVTVLATFLATFYLWARYKQTYWTRRGIPTAPNSHWFFGHFRDAILMRSAPPTVLGELHKSCLSVDEPILGVYIMQKPFLLLRNAELMKQILVKDSQYFPDRYFASKRKSDVIGSQNLFSIDNPAWKYLRVKLSPAFTTGKQKRLFELMLESSQNMSRYLEMNLPQDGTEMDMEVRKVASKYTTDVISSLAFGIRTDSFAEPEPEFYLRSKFGLTLVIYNLVFMQFLIL